MDRRRGKRERPKGDEMTDGERGGKEGKKMKMKGERKGRKRDK